MKSLRLRQSAFTLIEVTLALGVAAFCLLAILGLLPLGITANQNASDQTVAAGIASAISTDLHGSPFVSGSTSRFGLKIPAAGTTAPLQATLFFSRDGNATGAVGTGAAGTGSNPSLYRATINMTAAAPATPISPSTVTPPLARVFKVWILITWPALADSDPAKGPSHFSGSYETVLTLNCN